MAAATDKTLQCVIVTPEKAILDEKADFIVLPMIDGELGILANHAPVVGRIGKGELRLTQGNQVKKLQIEGGFAQVRSNVITVLTSKVQMV
jgi:F-type H+-transporting ATPase subunit epsilon